MRFLIVEDDENKRRQVVAFLADSYPASTLSEAKSLQSGLRAVSSESPDVVILDMSMPTFDISPDEPGGRPQVYAGREIMRRMNRRGVEASVVVLTQFDRFGEGADALTLEQLDEQLRASFGDIYLGAVYYNVTVEGWKESLRRVISDMSRPRGSDA